MHLEGWSQQRTSKSSPTTTACEAQGGKQTGKNRGKGAAKTYESKKLRRPPTSSQESATKISLLRDAQTTGRAGYMSSRIDWDQAERLEKDEGALYDLWALPVTPTTSPPTPHLLFPALWTLCHSLNSGKIKSVCWQPVWTAVTPAKTLHGHFVMAFDPQTPCGCRRHFLWTQKNLAFRYFC